MSTIKVSFKNVVWDDTTPDSTAVIPEGTPFTVYSGTDVVTSACVDKDGILTLSVPDGSTNLTLCIQALNAEDIVKKAALVVDYLIPAAPAEADVANMGVDWSNQPGNLPATPIGDWQQYANVSYAVSYFSLTGESPMSAFSGAVQITDKACPVVTNIPVCTEDIPATQIIGRNLYRQIVPQDGDPGETPIVLAGIIFNNTDTTYQDFTL